MTSSKQIHAFYHVYQHQGWEDLYMEQMHSLCISGLASNLDSLTIGIVGKDRLPYLPKINNINVVFHSNNREEADTLTLVRNFSRNNNDSAILYFHTKGITKKDFAINISCWRRYMEYFLIFGWKQCNELLNKGSDAVGVNFDRYTCFGDKPHFSGNMWWANSNYINILNDFYLSSDFRYDREFWIGSAISLGKPVTLAEIHNSGFNTIYGARHYHEIYSPMNYLTNVVPKIINFNH